MSVRNEKAPKSGPVLIAKKAYPEMPGDTEMELTVPARDTDGQYWPVGTIYQPLCGGASHDDNGDYQEVRINKQTVRFVRRSNKQESEYRNLRA